jgi:hypothetical protein
MNTTFRDNLSHAGFFKFAKRLIRDRHWALLPTAAQAIYPVIGVHMNAQNKTAFPAEDRMAVLAGCTPKTVRAGVNALRDFPGFDIESYVTSRGRRSKKFTFSDIPSRGRDYFAFHRIIIDGGNWRELRPAGKALYPVLRFFGFYDDDAMRENEDGDDFKDALTARTFDYCEAEIPVLTEHSGLCRNSVKAALGDMERCGLTDRDEDGRRRVYRIPPFHFKREYLNSQLQHRGQTL